MGRPRGRQDLKAQRAHETLDKGLKRRDALLLLDGLRKLPEGAREAAFGLAAPVIADAAAAQRRGGDQATLGSLAQQLSDEPWLPRLLAPLPEARRLALAWDLLAGALRQKAWTAARVYLALLRADLQARAPALNLWLSAYVEGAGGLSEAMPPLPLALREDELRLGYGPSRPQRRPPAPTCAEEVEGALLRLLAAVRPADLRDALRGWLVEAPEPLRPLLLQQAVPSLLYEALRQVQLGTLPHGLLRLVAELAGQRPGDEHIAKEVALAFRVAGSLLAEGRRPEALTTLLRLAVVAAAYEEQRPLVAEVLAQAPLPRGEDRALLAQLEDVLGVAPHPGLLARAILLFADTEDAEDEEDQPGLPPPPPWLVRAFEVVRGGLGPWLLRAEPKLRVEVLDVLADAFPVKPVAQLLDDLWALAEDQDPPLLRRLAHAVLCLSERSPADFLEEGSRELPQRQEMVVLLERARRLHLPMPPHMYEDLMADTLARSGPLSLDEARAYYSLADLVGRISSDRPPLSWPQRALLERFQERALPHHPGFLEKLLPEVSVTEGRGLLERYLQTHPTLDARLALMRLCYGIPGSKVLYRELLGSIDGAGYDAATLASTLLRVQREQPPEELSKELARSLLLTHQERPGPADENYATALRLARRLVPGPRPRRKKEEPRKVLKVGDAARPARPRSRPAAKPALGHKEQEP